jgi:hypothetical protein
MCPNGFQVCPDCDGDGCWRCEGGLVHPYDPDDAVVYLPDADAYICPRCRGPVEYRARDSAKWCRACARIFYTAKDWPEPPTAA